MSCRVERFRDIFRCQLTTLRPHHRVIERGGNTPSLRNFIAICYVLGADPTEVLREILENRQQFQPRT
jgi:hypothetical protein